MLIKPSSLILRDRMPHELGAKQPDGTYRVKHPPGCECQMIYTVHHAPWVNWNAMNGSAYCNRCGVVTLIPLPGKRENWFSKRVYMDLAAIENDLAHFQQKHENCEPPLSGSPESSLSEDQLQRPVQSA